MARRSPMNARYQKNTVPKGQTRKSAAAAKPKKASSAGSSKRPSSSSKSGSGSKQSVWIGDPKTPEFRSARRQWWISLGIGLAFTLVAIAVANLFKGASWSRVVQTVTLAIAYGGIFYALYVDWKKMRPMRKAWIAAGGDSAKPAKAEKKSTDAESTDDK